MNRKQRIEIVASVAWICIMGALSQGTSWNGAPQFQTGRFFFIGLVPVAAYWAYRFVKAAPAKTTE